MDNTALTKLSYGLFVLTAREGERDNGCIISTAMQVTDTDPPFGIITLNKQSFTHGMIIKTGKFNICTLTTGAGFDVFKLFGYASGADTDKFANHPNISRSENGLIYLTNHANSYLSFQVRGLTDFGTHTLFKGMVVDGQILNNGESMTYAHYQQHVKPKI